MKWLVLPFLSMVCGCSSTATHLDDWLKKNNIKVKSHLIQLNSTHMKTKISPLNLGDGISIFENHELISVTYLKDKKTYLYRFLDINLSREVTFLWVEEGGEYILPHCNQPESIDGFYPAWSGAVLSGDVYTYSKVNNESGVVSTYCEI